MTEREVSGAQPRPQTAEGPTMQQMNAAQQQVFDVKTMAILALVGFGGFSGGGIVSSIGTNNVQTSIAALQADVKQLAEQSVQIRQSLVEMQSGQRTADREALRLEKRLEALEKRVRELEDGTGRRPGGGR